MEHQKSQDTRRTMELFLCGDVMTGRGIDQALPHSVDPQLHERYIRDARDYLSLVHRRGGERIDTPVTYEWIWGDALEVWNERKPAVKIINLETSVTTNSEPWPGKGIHYRMHPKNVQLFNIADIDLCCLANNHVLDWGRKGMDETLGTLQGAGLKTVGAGKNIESARRPAVIESGQAEVFVLSAGHQSSGVPPSWAATSERSGVNFLEDLGTSTVREIGKRVRRLTDEHDVVIYSVHWGSNWGYEVPEAQEKFAHQLIDEAGVDVVFGHSSHHPRGFEVYKDHLIIYGAGDFINDYEGISGHEEYRDDLVLMYFPSIDLNDGTLKSLDLIPMKIRQFSLNHPDREETEWMYRLMQRESSYPGYNFKWPGPNVLSLKRE